ncbi:MAG: TatD family hydrolase [Rikenellaceae bacterium]
MIDSHIHLCDTRYEGKLDQIIERATAAGINRFIMPAADDKDQERIAEINLQYPHCTYATVGFHPTSVNDNPEWRAHLARVEYLLENPLTKYYAIGETGIDLHWSQDFLEQQKEAFRVQIELSIKYNLPLIIHTRDAWDATFEILEPYAGRVFGVIHSFSGSEREVTRIEKMGGFYYGINGTVTFKKSTLPEALLSIPLEKIILETDGPYLAPMPHRGTRNESAYIAHIAQKVAEIKGVTTAKLDEVTTLNTETLFRL